MTAEERDARNLLAEGALEKIADFEHDGRRVPASRLGYRMTERMATKYFGRIFLHPDVVFTPEMLRPELQDVGVFAESVATIVTTHERVARAYFKDGTITLAIPPLRALLEIMADGSTPRAGTSSRRSSGRCSPASPCSTSDWYAERLDAKQAAASARADAGLDGDREVRLHAGERGAHGPARHAGPGRGRTRGGAAARRRGVPRAARRNCGQHTPVRS